jgi:hypothetical protein
LKALALVCALAGIAHAESIEIVEPPVAYNPPPAPPTHTTLFGWRFGGGTVPVRGVDLQSIGLGLNVEHRVHGAWRIVGEYEYLWLGIRDPGSERESVPDGGGHRATLAVRRTLARSRRLADNVLSFYADAEAGGGFMLASEPMHGTLAMPHAFVGLRVGYSFYKLSRYTRAR